jgi:hypothetical protein
MLDEKIESFLRAQTADVRHSGRTLFEHLKGTHDLLQRRDAADYVCLAGLFHSIYGTNIFRHQAVPVSERHHVTELIGPKAELLAYIFCSCNRPRALLEAVKRGPPYHVVNWRDGEIILLSEAGMIDLLEIEAANLEDQGGGQLLPDVRKAHLIATGGRRPVSAAHR